MKLAALLVVALSLLVLSACRESDEEVLADACTELNEFQQAAANFEALGPTSTIDQLDDAAKDVREEAQEAARAVRQVADVRYQDLRDAQADFWDAVDDIDDDMSIAEVRALLAPKLADVKKARDDLTASLKCP